MVARAGVGINWVVLKQCSAAILRLSRFIRVAFCPYYPDTCCSLESGARALGTHVPESTQQLCL
jgi:hypothetical protein